MQPLSRPTKMTDEAVSSILEGIRAGLTYTLVCRLAKITLNTFQNWMQSGEAYVKELEAKLESGEITEVTPEMVHPLARFYLDVRREEALTAKGWLKQVDKAAEEGAWQAAVWRLERRFPKDYGRQVLEHVGEGGGPIKVAGAVKIVEVVKATGSLTAEDE